MTYTDYDKQNLKELVDDLKKYKKDLEKINYIHEQKKFFETMKEFRKYIALTKYDNIYEIFSHSKHYNEFKDFFGKMNMYYVRALESVQTISIMTEGKHKNDNLIDLLDSQLIRECYERKGEEIKSLDFTNAKNLICVGSGPMPETLLYIYENTNLDKIIGIDRDHEAIFMAGEMISGLGLNNIDLVQMEGTDYDYSESDIVYIPLFVSNKDEVLKRIIETGKKDIQILINSPKGLGNLVYDGVGTINPRLRVTYRNDAFSVFKAQEIIKLEKYDF